MSTVETLTAVAFAVALAVALPFIIVGMLAGLLGAVGILWPAMLIRKALL